MTYVTPSRRGRSLSPWWFAGVVCAAPIAAHAQQPATIEIAPIEVSAPPLATPPPPTPAPTEPAPENVEPPVRAAEGEVQEIRDDEVIVSGEHWLVGDSVEFYRIRNGRHDALEEGIEVVGVGEVRVAADDRARVRVGVDTRLERGTLARSTAHRGRIFPIAPPRLADLFTLATDLRLFLPVGSPIGIGALGGASLTYRFGAPVAIHAELSPLGGVSSGPSGGAAAGTAFVTLDTSYFEIGLGPGFMTYSSTDYSTCGYYPCPSATVFGTSFMLSQYVRVGAIDGLNVTARSDVYTHNNQFEFGNLTVSVQIPVAPGWWVLARGGGGAAGFAYGEAAIRHLVRGNGDHGSVFLTGGLGGAGITELATYGTTLVAGPSVEFGLEWRI